METVKDILKQLLDSKENKSLNLKKLNEYFGEENLKRLENKNLRINLYSNSWDGQHVLEVDLNTGLSKQYYDWGDVSNDLLLNEMHLKKIKEEIFKNLEL